MEGGIHGGGSFNITSACISLSQVRRGREGVQSSSNSNHPQKSIKLNRLFLRNKTILTSFNGPMVYNIVKAFFIAP